MASALRLTSSDTGIGDDTLDVGVRGTNAGRFDADDGFGDPGGRELVRGTYAAVRTAVADMLSKCGGGSVKAGWAEAGRGGRVGARVGECGLWSDTVMGCDRVSD